MSSEANLRKRVLVTRATGQAGRLSAALRAAGFEPVEVPMLEIVAPESFAPLDEALCRISKYDWLILTSANTVRALTERATLLGLSLALAQTEHGLRVAAIGNATAESARGAGLAVTLVPEAYVAEELVSALRGKIAAGARVLLARAAVARDVVPEALKEAHVQIDVVEAYQNRLPSSAPTQLREALRRGIAAVVFTSSSSVTHLAEACDQAHRPFPFVDIPAFSIGPITSQALRAHGWEPAAEANPSDITGLVAAAVRGMMG